MKKRTQFLKALCHRLTLSILLAASTAHAAILVSDVAASKSGSVVTLRYRLNEAALSGTLSIAPAGQPNAPVVSIPLSGGQLTPGPHAVAAPAGLASGPYVFTVRASAAPHSAYDVIVPPTPIASNATVAYGLRVNRAASTPGYGHIFAADFQGGANALHAVHEFAADGAFVQDVAPPRAGRYTTVALALGPDGALYVSDQDTDALRRYTASGPPDAPVWTLDRTLTGPLADPSATPPRGSLPTRGFQVMGAGDAAALFLSDYTTYPNQVETATPSDASATPARLFDGGNLGARVDQLLVSPDMKAAYIAGAVGTGLHLNRWLYGTNPATGATDWYLDPAFGENNAATASLAGTARGLAFNTGGDLLWVTQNGGRGSAPAQNFIAKVTLTPLAQSLLRAARALAILGGASTTTAAEVRSLDTNGDGRITLEDAAAIAATPSVVGAVIERIPAPAGLLPVTMDTDPKGNLVVGADSRAGGDGLTADVFFTLAPPDSGSQDTAAGPSFTIG